MVKVSQSCESRCLKSAQLQLIEKFLLSIVALFLMFTLQSFLNIEKKKYFYPFFLFFLAIIFMSFFTAGVPFFWDDHAFNEYFLSLPPSFWLKEMIPSFQFHISDSREIYGLSLSILFSFFKYSFVYYRLAKALVFGLVIFFFFFLCDFFLENKRTSFLFCLFPLFSFPLYIHTLVFDEPFIIMEMFKLGAFVLFLSWYSQWRKKIISFFHPLFFLFLLFAFLSINSYIGGYSILGIIPLFLFFERWNDIKHSKLIAAVLFVIGIIFAVLGFLLLAKSAPYGVHLSLFEKTFLRGWWEIGHTPFITFEELYYKPFAAIISFFGIWLLFFSLFLFLLALFLRRKLSFFFSNEESNKNPNPPKGEGIKGMFNVGNTLQCEGTKRDSIVASDGVFPTNTKNEMESYRLLFFLGSAWLLGELPLWLALPEHAIRYTSSLIFPFTLLFGMFIFRAYCSLNEKNRKRFLSFILFCLIGIILTNLLYITAFRIGWGSSFIATDKAGEYIRQLSPESIALYYALSAGDEYVLLTKNISNYSIAKQPVFFKTNNIADFEKAHLQELSGISPSVFVIQRITPQGNTLPPLTSDQREDLELVTHISGLEENIFDKTYIFIMQLFGRKTPTTEIVIYKLRSET